MPVKNKRKATDPHALRCDFKPGEYPESEQHIKQRAVSHSSHSDPGSMELNGHAGDWSVVDHSRKKRRKIEQKASEYPSLNFLKASPPGVELKALQDLVLYVLADGVAPTWLAMADVAEIKKIVVLMVPGLDKAMLLDSDLWNSVAARSEDETDGVKENLAGDLKGTIQEQDPASIIHPRTKSPSEASHGSTTAKTPREYLLEHVLPVRAPGDSHMTRVFSPLQNMLIAPLVPKQGKKNGKDRSSHATRTPIENFVHSSFELQDADYPVHPAAFTDPQDAKLEQQRREKTGQSTSAGWVETNVTNSSPQPTPSQFSPQTHDPLTRGLRPYALDCEMVLTSDDAYSLARISLVDWAGKIIIDKCVKPTLPIKNYFTEFSGITEEILKGVTTTLEDIQKELLGFIGPDSILLGHSLESDFNALKLTHPFVIDTSIIYPHPRGLPLRSSLKFLAKRYLQREIQKGGLNGHDSVEDACAVLDLVRQKCEKGPSWGTLDANGESIFRRIGGKVKLSEGGTDVMLRTSAIVEYGTPERGLGKDATYHIACKSDDEIVSGILRAACGDSMMESTGIEANHPEENAREERTDEGETNEPGTSKIPSPGADFIWSRLRDLEAIQGWNVLSSDSITMPSSTASTPTLDPPNKIPESTEATDLRTVQIQTLRRVLQTYTSLPPRTLFILYSGTGDMRPLLRLQNLQAQYKREFKVKKWDELTVKWTDKEEQELRKECASARKGVGIVALTRPAKTG